MESSCPGVRGLIPYTQNSYYVNNTGNAKTLTYKILEQLLSADNTTYLKNTISNSSIPDKTKQYVIKNFDSIYKSYINNDPNAFSNGRDIYVTLPDNDKFWAMVRQSNLYFLQYVKNMMPQDTDSDRSRYDYAESMLRATDMRQNPMYRENDPPRRDDALYTDRYDGYHSSVMKHWSLQPMSFAGNDNIPVLLPDERTITYNNKKSGYANINDRMMMVPEMEQRYPPQSLPFSRPVTDEMCKSQSIVDGNGPYGMKSIYSDHIVRPDGSEVKSYGEVVLESLPPAEREATDRETYLARIGKNKWNEGAIPFFQQLSKRNFYRTSNGDDDQLDRLINERDNEQRSKMILLEPESGGLQTRAGTVHWHGQERTNDKLKSTLVGSRNYRRDDEPTQYNNQFGNKLRGYPTASWSTTANMQNKPYRELEMGYDTRTPCGAAKSKNCGKCCDTRITLTGEPAGISGPSI